MSTNRQIKMLKELTKTILPDAVVARIRYRIFIQGLERRAERNGMQCLITASYLDFIDGNRVIRLGRQHWFYGFDILNSFDYYFNAVRPLRFNDIELVDYSTPRYHDVNDFDLMPVFFPSLSEPITTTQQYLSFANLKPGCVVIDLGAYSGLTSIYFRELVGDAGRVIAMDADEKNLDAINRNLALYRRLTGNEVEVVFGAVWNHSDGLNFSSEGNMGSSAIEIVGKTRGENKLVQSYTLSKLSDQLELNRVDFIKCDVEGAERVIFEDAEFLNRYSPRIIIETHLVEGQETTDKCIADLSRFGYVCKRIEQVGVSLPLLECYPPQAT